MESRSVERGDHGGVLAAVIKDGGLIERIDARLVPDEQEELTPGEAVAGMIRHGGGLAQRPLSLPPQVLANNALDLLGHAGVRAELCNRFPLGRTLEATHAYGGARLLSALARAVCQQARLARCCNHLDTTSLALTGEYGPESETQARTLPHGSSTAHRPDLQQAVLELMVSQDGGVPGVSTSWEGHPADTQIFQERAQACMQTVARAPTPRYWVADAKLSTEENAATLHKLGGITRLPNTLKRVAPVIGPALPWATWPRVADTTRSPRREVWHSGRAQRWLVVSAPAALARAAATVSHAQQRA